MSVVVRISNHDRSQVLLTGDIDAVGLENLMANVADLHARVLVFPHHGGLPGQDDPYDFARRLCEAVSPDVVVFSIGRGKHATPRPDIVAGVRAAAQTVHVACTQLSEHCAAALPTSQPTHLSDRPARGKASNACCAGSIVVTFNEMHEYVPLVEDHATFISAAATYCSLHARPRVPIATAGDFTSWRNCF